MPRPWCALPCWIPNRAIGQRRFTGIQAGLTLNQTGVEQEWANVVELRSQRLGGTDRIGSKKRTPRPLPAVPGQFLFRNPGAVQSFSFIAGCPSDRRRQSCPQTGSASSIRTTWILDAISSSMKYLSGPFQHELLGLGVHHLRE